MKTGFDQYIIEAQDSGNIALAKRIGIEKRLSSALVGACINRGYLVSLNDGQEWVIKKSHNKTDILAAMFTTDTDTILIRAKSGEKAGQFYLLYGNDGTDVIADYTHTEPCEAIWNEIIKPIIEKIEMAA